MKRSSATAIVALLFIIFAGTVSAGPAQGIDGKGRVGRLYLFEKDPVTWNIVKGGAFGIMTYKVPQSTVAEELFIFDGHRLTPDTDFSLIYYPDSGLIVLGKGTSDESGNVHIAGHFNFGAILPLATDAQLNDGARIWLVLSKDLGTNQMLSWTPTEYLFEYRLI
jgi:hypothetical protein